MKKEGEKSDRYRTKRFDTGKKYLNLQELKKSVWAKALFLNNCGSLLNANVHLFRFARALPKPGLF
jgi:hypothetical protein